MSDICTWEFFNLILSLLLYSWIGIGLYCTWTILCSSQNICWHWSINLPIYASSIDTMVLFHAINQIECYCKSSIWIEVSKYTYSALLLYQASILHLNSLSAFSQQIIQFHFLCQYCLDVDINALNTQAKRKDILLMIVQCDLTIYFRLSASFCTTVRWENRGWHNTKSPPRCR